MDDLGQARKQRTVRSSAVERNKAKETDFGAAGAPPVIFPERRIEKRYTEANAKEPEDKMQKITGDEPVAHLLLTTPVAGSTDAAASSSTTSIPPAVSSLPTPVLPATSQSGARSASPTVTRSRTPIGNRIKLSDSQLMLIELKKQSALTIGSMKTISEASIAAGNAATAGNQLMAQTFATPQQQQQQNAFSSQLMTALTTMTSSIQNISANLRPPPAEPAAEPAAPTAPATPPAGVNREAMDDLFVDPAALVRITKVRDALTDTHEKGLRAVQRAFKKDLGKHIRQSEKAANLRGEVEILDRPEGCPKGIRMLQIDPGMIEMDSYFSETIDRDIAVEFTIPRNTSRRDALTMIHRQALRLSRRIELEAAVEGERMKHSKIGKTTFVTSCELVEDEVHVPAEVPPGMEELREPTLITNNELFTEKVEALFKTTVESVIKEWQKKRLKIRSDKDEVAAGEEAVIHTNPAELFKDLVGQLVEKTLYEARNEAPLYVDENGDARIGDAESEATPDDQFDKLVEHLRALDKDDAGADSSESKGKKKKHKKKKKRQDTSGGTCC